MVAIRRTASPTTVVKSSGSRRSPSAVDPTTSLKNALTTLRASRSAAAVTDAPQEGQKRCSSASGLPQVGDVLTARV